MKFRPGQILMFTPTGSGMEPGLVTVLRSLRPDEVDEEAGPMYKVRYTNGGNEHAFEDELRELTDEDRRP